MTRIEGRLLALAGLLLAPIAVAAQGAAAAEAAARGEDVYLGGPSVDVTSDVSGDLVAGGGTVRVGASVAAAALVAGGNVAIDGPVEGDVFAAGGDVVLRGRCGDDARLAGGNVRIAGPVDDDAIAAGGTVRIERDAVVGGRAWLAGGEVVVAGTVGRELRAGGRRVSIEGTVQGDVEVTAQTLEIGPAARIRGNLLHRGPGEPRIDPGARIGGRVEHRRAEAPPERGLGVFGLVLTVVALLVAGAALILLFPRFTHAAARTLGKDPWRSLGLGAAALLFAPAVVLALVVTAVGIPLGLVLLAGWLVALLVGYLVTAVYLGTLGLRRTGRPAPSRGALVLGLLVALLVLRLLALVPFLGGLVSLAALLFGLGALVLQLYRAYRAGGRAEVAGAAAPAAGRPV